MMKQYFKKWRPFLAYSFFFSFFINILSLTFSFYMLSIYDQVLTSYSLSTLVAITIVALFALFVGSSLSFVRGRLLVRCGVTIEHTLNRDVLPTILKSKSLPGPPLDVSLQDVTTLRTFFSGPAVTSLFDVPWVPVFLGATFYLHFWLGTFATIAGILLFFLAIINEKLTGKPLGLANYLHGRGMAFVDHAVKNAEVVCGMGMLPGIARQWQHSNLSVVTMQTEASRHGGLINSITSAMRQSLQVGIYAVGAYLALQNKISVGSIIAASIIMGQALRPVQSSISTWKGVIDARGAYKRLDQVLKGLKDQPQMELPEPKGMLLAEHLSFALQGKYMLQGLSFVLRPGESLGLIGPSGAGKSTLCKLLLGIWPPTSGKVRLDGADIFAWEHEVLGRHIGYLPQDVRLLSGTVNDNIARFGVVDPEKVVEAATMAGINEFLLTLPDGYNTQIGPETMALSGGQRQRLCLARALYNNPRLLIMDEPNSNLDQEGEKALHRALALAKLKGTTIILVTHKPSLLAAVDKILLLVNGQMVHFGPREEVLQKLNEARLQAMAAQKQAKMTAKGPMHSGGN